MQKKDYEDCDPVDSLSVGHEYAFEGDNTELRVEYPNGKVFSLEADEIRRIKTGLGEKFWATIFTVPVDIPNTPIDQKVEIVGIDDGQRTGCDFVAIKQFGDKP